MLRKDKIMAIKDISEEVNRLREFREKVMTKLCNKCKQFECECPDMINHPPHYNSGAAKCECGRRIECIDIVKHMNFNLGNAMKYIWRAEYKSSIIQDLQKACWYLECEITRVGIQEIEEEGKK